MELNQRIEAFSALGSMLKSFVKGSGNIAKTFTDELAGAIEQSGNVHAKADNLHLLRWRTPPYFEPGPCCVVLPK